MKVKVKIDRRFLVNEDFNLNDVVEYGFCGVVKIKKDEPTKSNILRFINSRWV